MAWFRPMGIDEVAYHQATVVGRSDDHPGAALDYYGSRGETPLRWGGAGAARLGLHGEVTADAYAAAFGPGGFRLPEDRVPLVQSRRPGFELVIGAHKSVAALGVVGHADAMHSILDVETVATMATLDAWFQERGGRRGRAQERSATGGLVYAVTRHATSRAGDPAPHDHVLVANIVEMLDERGGFKALDSAALRDTVEAATMVGRLHAAAHAVSLGFAIERDDGPSGNLRHWRLAAVPDEVCELFSKRSDEIAEHLAESGRHSYRARSIAARATRTAKRHTGVDELLPAWHAELEQAGHSPQALARQVTPHPGRTPGLAPGLTPDELDLLVSEILDTDGRLLTRHKVFTCTHLVTELAPRLYGCDPSELDRALAHLFDVPDLIPLINTGPTREQAYTTRAVLEAEQTIAQTAQTLANRPGAAVPSDRVAAAVAGKEQQLARPLSAGQRRLVDTVCRGERAVSLVVGVAGSGKTTALDAATDALESAGHRVLGVSTSGQAARTLSREAGVDASTFASLLRRLDTRTTTLGPNTVVVVDEAGMADDADLSRLLLAAARAGSSVVLVGDHRQLPAVGPGGAFAALIRRHPDLVVTLDANVRQPDPGEREALANLRHGSAHAAIGWYDTAGRIRVVPTRTDTLVAMSDAWAEDISAGHDTALLAWRRADVADLNRLARAQWDRLGHLNGDDIHVAGGRPYAAGEGIVAIAPNHAAGIVTSERLTITSLTEHCIQAVTDDGRDVEITGHGIDRDHLDYGYAVTVHRAQGLTCDRAHILAAGGGRELAYVAMSRAKEHTIIHTTAPDRATAMDVLTEEWGAAADELWITETSARSGTEMPPHGHPRPVQGPLTTMNEPELRHRLRTLEHDLQCLHLGIGRWNDTPEGAAARSLLGARDRLTNAERLATAPDARRRDRRAAAKSLDGLAISLAAAERDGTAILAPTTSALRDEICAVRQELNHRETAELRRTLDRLQIPGPAVEQHLTIGL